MWIVDDRCRIINDNTAQEAWLIWTFRLALARVSLSINIKHCTCDGFEKALIYSIWCCKLLLDYYRMMSIRV